MAQATFHLQVDFQTALKAPALDAQVTMTGAQLDDFSWLYFSSNGSATAVLPSTWYLKYDIWVDPNTSAADVFFDIDTSAAFLYLSAAVDQNGVAAGNTPAAAIGAWHSRRIALPTSWVGLHTLHTYAIAFDNDAAGSYHARFRNIVLTNSASAVQKSLWVAPDPLPTITASHSDASNTYSATVLPVFNDRTWTDISTALWSFSVRRGRQHELDRTEAGTLTAMLDNRTRVFDPTYSAGAWTTGLTPLRAVRLTADLNGTNYPIFNGFAEAWTQHYELAAAPQVELRAADAFKVLSLSGLRGSTYAAQDTEARFNSVLDNIGWSTVNRSTTGAQSFQASADYTSQDQNALEHLQAAVQAEQGRFYARRDGVLRFEHRHVPYNSTVPSYTYDETHVRGLEFEYSDVNIWNEIQTQTANADAPLHTTADSATSQMRYLKRTLGRTGLPLDDDNEAEDLGTFLLTNYKEPAERVVGIALLGELATTTYRDALLERELGDRVVVDYEPRFASAETIAQESFIEGIEVNGARGTLPTWALRLSPIGISFTLGAPWILATATGSTDGVLGTNTVLRY